ncbi:Biotin--protein ligase [Mizuhopecten yessoensis]|uniref:Biotin--protein ligase n=1 Tax=Mizuhopecten yessoensis TaxID=6573 RepID=A0A210PGJ6_MIZYE|nr:Biotin--protein ligase [Mizuhopecten yessoensis]
MGTVRIRYTCRGAWAKDAALFMMPGGFDLGFIESLGDEGAEEIKKYVREGGSYLGQGAGSYFACDSIQFDINGTDEVVGDRPLKFYPGICSGPVYAPYHYNDYSGARAAPIDFEFISPTTGDEEESINMRAYYNGGNTFQLPIDNENRTCVTLGSYTERIDNPAIVKCNIYDGITVLAGVEMQFGSTHLDSNDHFLSVIKQQLKPYESSRLRAYDSILRHLGLTTRFASAL